MTFLMGSVLWWVAGAAVVSVPILIHLLHRQRTQPVLWGAMMFLRQSTLQQKRRKRVENWLLLLLRILLLALLVFLLARPLWNSAAAGVGIIGRPAADIGIVIDHSLSTRWKVAAGAGQAGVDGKSAAPSPAAAGSTADEKAPGDRTLFDQAIATVSTLAGPNVLKPNDTVSIVLAERTPRKVSPFLVDRAGVPPLLDALKKVKPGATRASIPEAIQAARELVGRGRNARKVIYVLSDGQRTNWEPTSLDKWSGAVGRRAKGAESNLTVYELPLTPAAKGSRANLAVLDVKIDPKVIGRDRRATVTATVKNTGGSPVSKASAGLWVNGKPVGSPQQQPTLAPGDSRTVQFDHEFTALNSNAVEVRLDVADGFDADNVAAASVFVLPAVPVLVIDAQGGGPVGDAADPISLLRYKASAYLTSAMLADAKDVDAPAFLAPTVVSYSDGPRLRALADGKMARTVRLPDGRLKEEKVGLDSFAAVILNDVPRVEATLQGKLLDYCRSGRGLWYILGPKTEPAFVRDQIVGGNLFKLRIEDEPATAKKLAAGDKAATDDKPATGDAAAAAGSSTSAQVEVKDREYEVLRPFASAERNVLTGMTTQRWWKLSSQEGDAQIPLATADGGGPGLPSDPLILERAVGSAGGRLVIWTSPVDGTSGWNNWTTMKAFAPMVNLTAYRLAGGITKGQEARVESGKSLVWASPVLRDAASGSGGGGAGGSAAGGQQLVFPDGQATPPVQWAEAVGPSGVKSRVRPVTRDGRQWAFFGDTFEPGKYEVRFDNSQLPPVYYGVGIDPAELDETTLTADDRKWLASDDHKFVEKAIEPGDFAATLATGVVGDKGMDLWPWLAAGLLAILLSETFLTHRMIRRQTGPATAAAGPAPGGFAPSTAAAAA